MSTYYLRVETHNRIRKILIDMAFLAKHNIIRLPKYYYEEGLYLPYKSDGNSTSEKYELTKDKIIREDEDHYFFKFPFKYYQVEGVAV